MDTGRLAPFALMLLFLSVGIGVRSWLHARRHGSSGIVLFRERGAAWWRDLVFLLSPLLLLAQPSVEWLAPHHLDAVRWSLSPTLAGWCHGAGALLVLAATALMFAAQLDLGASWRVGIDYESRPGLVVDGFYRYSRNPIFACMLPALFGFLLLMPTHVSLALLAAAFWTVRKQVLQEERHLSTAYGDAYLKYAARVGRFFPSIGRLRPTYRVGRFH